jgi:hypothetical protein
LAAVWTGVKVGSVRPYGRLIVQSREVLARVNESRSSICLRPAPLSIPIRRNRLPRAMSVKPLWTSSFFGPPRHAGCVVNSGSV